MLYLSCLQTVIQPIEDPTLPEQLVSPPADPLFSASFKFHRAAEFDGIVGYVEFDEIDNISLDPPPHKTHYAIPFDINDDTDHGRHHPKTVSRCRSDYFHARMC